MSETFEQMKKSAAAAAANMPTRSMLYKQHPYKQQLVIAVKFYILLLKSENKQHTKIRLV